MKAISVLMPTYNAGKFVAEAIQSVQQQSFEDWELVIVDDGSTDDTCEIVRSFADTRIRLLCNGHDFIGSLNMGLKAAMGKYIARMDADDVMHPDRLKIQYAIMEEEPEITVCGSWIRIFGENKPGIVPTSLKGKLTGIYDLLLKQNPLFHPTVMMRGEFLRKHSLQYECYSHAEDYKLWFEIAKKGGVFFVEDQPLMFYRASESQVSNVHTDEQKETSCRIRKEVLEYLVEKAKNYQSIPLIKQGLEIAEKEGLVSMENMYKMLSIILPKSIINN